MCRVVVCVTQRRTNALDSYWETKRAQQSHNANFVCKYFVASLGHVQYGHVPIGVGLIGSCVCVGVGWGREGKWYTVPRALKVQTKATNAQ